MSAAPTSRRDRRWHPAHLLIVGLRRVLPNLEAALPRNRGIRPPLTYPEPVEHCGICRWWAVCRDRRRADEHLSLVAGMRRDQTRRLVQAGVTTRIALANATADDVPARVPAKTFEKLRSQAALQVRGEGCVPPLHELLPMEDSEAAGSHYGFGALPAPSPGDLFLDLEGDPYALDGGLEYLFGLVESGRRRTGSTTRSGRTLVPRNVRRSKRRSTSSSSGASISGHARLPLRPVRAVRLPAAHGRARHLRGRGRRLLLRGDVFVDLYRVVRQAVRLSTESYSLKEVEKLYLTRPPGAVMDAGSSIIAYERYLVDHEQNSLDEIAAYNRDDCESLDRPAGVARGAPRRRRGGSSGRSRRPTPHDAGRADGTLEPDERAQPCTAARRRARRASRAHRRRSRPARLLAQLLEWHRREAKPDVVAILRPRRHLRTARRSSTTPSASAGSSSSRMLGADQAVDGVPHALRTAGPQVLGRRAADRSRRPSKGAGTIVAIDDRASSTSSAAAARGDDPLPRALIPGGPYDTTRAAGRDRRGRASGWSRTGSTRPGRTERCATCSCGTSPRLPARCRQARRCVRPASAALDAACRLVLALDGGCLAVQGPPGAGKTFTGARMIVALLAAGRRVGITATTHGAISNS